MPCHHVTFGSGRNATHAILTLAGDYKPGDPPPEGYIERQEWARVQMKAGLRQVECGQCGRWCFPQQLSDTERVTPMRTSQGRAAKVMWRICTTCDVPKDSPA